MFLLDIVTNIGIVQGELIWLNIVICNISNNNWKAKLILIAVGPVQDKFVMLTIFQHIEIYQDKIISLIGVTHLIDSQRGNLALLNCVVLVVQVCEKQISFTQYKTDWSHLGRTNLIRCCNILKSSRQYNWIEFCNNMNVNWFIDD